MSKAENNIVWPTSTTKQLRLTTTYKTGRHKPPINSKPRRRRPMADADDPGRIMSRAVWCYGGLCPALIHMIFIPHSYCHKAVYMCVEWGDGSPGHLPSSHPSINKDCVIVPSTWNASLTGTQEDYVHTRRPYAGSQQLEVLKSNDRAFQVHRSKPLFLFYTTNEEQRRSNEKSRNRWRNAKEGRTRKFCAMSWP